MQPYKYFRKDQLPEEYPLTKRQLDRLFRKRFENGLFECTRKIGNTLFVRIDLFNEWLESYKQPEKIMFRRLRATTNLKGRKKWSG